MNYEETVVYNNDAVRPAYLIVYELDRRNEENSPETSYGYGQVQEPYASDYDDEEEEEDPQIRYSGYAHVQEPYASEEVQETYEEQHYEDLEGEPDAVVDSYGYDGGEGDAQDFAVDDDVYDISDDGGGDDDYDDDGGDDWDD